QDGLKKGYMEIPVSWESEQKECFYRFLGGVLQIQQGQTSFNISQKNIRNNNIEEIQWILRWLEKESVKKS
ncbi:MAG TPA: hypothetical protein VIY47_08180, partial [Ignavibacteriaceae bacterium]